MFPEKDISKLSSFHTKNLHNIRLSALLLSLKHRQIDVATNRKKEDAHVKKVRRTLKFHFAVMNELKSLKKQNRKAIRFEGHFLRKYKCLNQLHRDLKIAYVRRNTKSKLLSTMQKEKVNIRGFFLRPDNSRILTGMKKKQPL